MRRRVFRNFFGSTAGDYFPAFFSPFGPQVHQVIRLLDYLHVVLDNHHGVTVVHQPFQHLQQLVYIVHVKAGSRLIQNIKSLAVGPAGELRGQLDPLGFTSRESGGRLSQANVAQSHVVKVLKLSLHPGNVGEQIQGFFYGKIQYFGNV